jgi:hypothetical protein
MNKGHEGAEAAENEARVQARCVWCGGVEFALGELRVHTASAHQGLLEFSCPTCGRLNVRPLGGTELEALGKIGAPRSSGPAPFELLEEHIGPPISWDDLIDFHEAVTRLEGEDRPRHADRPARFPAEERDAA